MGPQVAGPRRRVHRDHQRVAVDPVWTDMRCHGLAHRLGPSRKYLAECSRRCRTDLPAQLRKRLAQLESATGPLRAPPAWRTGPRCTSTHCSRLTERSRRSSRRFRRPTGRHDRCRGCSRRHPKALSADRRPWRAIPALLEGIPQAKQLCCRRAPRRRHPVAASAGSRTSPWRARGTQDVKREPHNAALPERHGFARAWRREISQARRGAGRIPSTGA
jgi:hypothetical protein